MRTRVFLTSIAILLAAPAWSADETPTPATSGKRTGVWWQWDINRDWTSQERRAWGIIKLYADPAKKQPLKVDSLRFSLEMDCPAADGPEKVISETRDASQLTAEVRCAMPGANDYQIRWAFEAEDPRTGLVKDSGVSK